MPFLALRMDCVGKDFFVIVEKHFFAFGIGNAMFSPVLFAVSFVPGKLNRLGQTYH